ncbi:MAG: alpha/beta fold hydrolase [Gammaproteobacteria bacterium]|nr:alpha/beta fold hydrolase [Gammaproteobacteria bacterium]
MEWGRLLGIALLLILLSACAAMRPLAVPVVSQAYVASPQRSDTLIVLLPGISDSVHEFEQAGFLWSARRQGIDADIWAVDAHYGYYHRGVIVERLRYDIIEPARRQGYRHIWLVGFSLGGFGSLLYLKSYPHTIDGVLLIAPFLGSGSDSPFDPAELLQWRNGEHGLWQWLQDYAAGPRQPPIYLGYGAQDKFAPVIARLAEQLPADHVLRMPGEHNWKTWRLLWDRVLERQLLFARLPPTISAQRAP